MSSSRSSSTTSRPTRRLPPPDPGEEQLRHVQRLAMQGELAATAVHEISNLLTIVLLNAGLLRELHKDDPEESKYLEPLLHAATLITKLCSQLRNLARTSATQAQPVELVETARRTFRLLEQIMMTREMVFVAPAAGDVHTFGDPAHIDQLLFNLVLNARDATSDEGGRITIRVGHGSRPGGFIEVEDNGTGMTAPVKRQLFRAFFTTKPPGQGTGLGLVTVQRLMQGMGGSIRLSSRPGRGTRVRLQFPPLRIPDAEPVFSNGPHPAGTPAQPGTSP
jgi:two-component system cell cycle sensor histidine kinase/response regulator CckA